MSLFEDTNPRALKELLAEVHSRVAVLPNFQRDFVWDPGATQELIVSIANNYPAGSILRVRDTSGLFACREFQGSPPLNGHRHTFLVLDGQQRLTSLYQAFYGVGEHRYYLDLAKMMAGAGEFEEAIFHLRATRRFAKALEDFETQCSEMMLPLSVLKGGAGGFLKWLLAATDTMPPAERTRRIDALKEIHDRWVQTIDDYHFPVVTLSADTDGAALCTIFETLNRTGVKLSVFELLTARFWPHDLNLRQLWDESCAKHPIIPDFGVDPYYLLQAVALACRKAPSCKRSDVLNLKSEDVKEWWPKVVAGLHLGLDILRDDCKVMLPKWLPYQTMLPPLAAMLARLGAPRTAEAGAQREAIKRWFWCAVLGQAYENAPNSQSAKDVGEILAWTGGGPLPEVIRGFQFDPKVLRDITPRQRSVYRGIMCLLLGSGTGARDFHTQAVITGKLMLAEGIDDHHGLDTASPWGVDIRKFAGCV